MRVSHKVTAVFDDPNLISVGGLAPVMALAERAGLHELVTEHVTVPGSAGANAAVKVPAVVAGMVTGADSISDLDLLRHGGMGRLFDGLRAPTTLGTFLRAVSFGHVRQFDAVAFRLLIGLAAVTPVLAGADQVTYLDVDDTIRETHGYAKQGAGYGYTGVKGLNALVATVSTPLAAPVIAATKLRKGATNSAKGAFRLIGHALATVRQAGAGTARGGMVTVRADSAYYNHRVVAAARRGGARFSITARMDTAVRAGDHRDRRGRLDGDPVSERDLGGGRAALDLRRRGRRDRIHRLHVPSHGPAGSRPVDRPAGEAAQPSSSL